MKYKESDIYLFLTFSFSSAGLANKPTILFSDWTYDYYFSHFLNRKPNRLERYSVEREDKQIEQSDLIIVLYPGAAEYMKKHYKNKNIYYLGNVVNSIIDTVESNIIDGKYSSNDLLFIGGKQYLEGAKLLIKAYTVLKSEYPNLSLHIVGIKSRDFDNLPAGVYCYGYLDKAKHNERELYYSLLKKSKAFINTTPKWGAFSATIEAMYFYNPVITTPYNEFVNTFGYNINFGYYCENDSTDILCSMIKKIFEDESYKIMCINAHNSVKTYTWDSFVDKMLIKVKDLL